MSDLQFAVDAADRLSARDAEIEDRIGRLEARVKKLEAALKAKKKREQKP